MDVRQPLQSTPVTTEMALKAIVRIAEALQKEAKVSAGFKANLPAICDQSVCQVCDPSVRRIRCRPLEGSNVGTATIDFKKKIDKLGGTYPEMWKMFFTRIRWEKWYENSEERIDVRHFVMDKQAFEWAMMFLGHGEFSERKTMRRGHEESEGRLKNKSKWIRKLRGAIASMLRNWEVISYQLGRTMRKRAARRQEKERRRKETEEKRKLRDEVEKCVGEMHLNANMAEPIVDEEARPEVAKFEEKMAEPDCLKQFIEERTQRAHGVQGGTTPAVEKKDSSCTRGLSDKEESDSVELSAPKRMAGRHDLSLSDRRFFVEESEGSDDEEVLDTRWNVEGGQCFKTMCPTEDRESL